jgi:hypothetical protein
MKKLALPVVFLFWIAYPRKSSLHSDHLNYYVPADYPSLQSAIDAAAEAVGNNIMIIVGEGEYREMVVAVGLKNLKLIGRNARILPPPDLMLTGPPAGENCGTASPKLIDCENSTVEGFTFVGDDFPGSGRSGYPMGHSILA